MQYPFSPLPKVLISLEKTISPARLARFLPTGSHDKNHALRLYVWNARLCEEFYLPLQLTEVALRNGIQRRLVGVYGANWYTDAKLWSTLPSRHRSDLADVVTEERQRRGALFSADHVVAGLPFGFWHSLMGHSLAHILWKYGIKEPFPKAPKTVRREDVFTKLERLRKFRNAVMHHYAIFDTGPSAEYQNIRLLMSWMCSDTLWLMGELSNPAAVLQARPKC